MDHLMVVLASTLCTVCVVFLVMIALYVAWSRHRNNILRKELSYSPVSAPYDEDYVAQEKLHMLQPSPRLETVPFQVPGPVTARGWGPASVTPLGSLSSLLAGSVSSLGSTEALIKTDSDETDSSWQRIARNNKLAEVAQLGNLDPTLYRHHDTDDDYELPDRHIGRIWFRIQYERETEKLLVTLVKAKNLPSKSLSTASACDPFVRLYLLPDERRYLQSKCKKKTCHPNFNEDFIFQVPQRMFNERELKLTVFDLYKRQRTVGHATYPLCDHNPEESAYVWRDLERELPETSLDRGEIKVSLSYNPHYERLTVGVYEGRNIKPTMERGPPDFYVRVCLLIQSRVTKTKRTSTVRHTCNPVFNESFNFKLVQNQLDSASITINAMQIHSGVKDKCSGRIVLGSFMFARGKELEHWNEMVANKVQQVSRWHSIT